LPAAVTAYDTVDPRFPVARDTCHRDAFEELRPGVFCGAEQERIENVAAGRVQCIHTSGFGNDGLHRHSVDVAQQLPRSRSSGTDQTIEQAPATELHDTRMPDVVGGQRVTRKPSSIDDSHTMPSPGQKHRGGSSGNTPTHDYHIKNVCFTVFH
jgi:hypothetical protein